MRWRKEGNIGKRRKKKHENEYGAHMNAMQWL
jgi:hypothetical protein